MIESRLFSLSEIITLTGGTLLSRETPRSLANTSVSSVAVDSRNVVAGTLFVALPGEHTDGHCFLADARTRGASILLVEKGQQWRYYQQHLPGCSAVAVGSTLFALQELAKAWVSRFPSLQKLAVTGSSGKTTTKEMLSSILSQMGPTAKNP
ncbi:MAG: Mur ligase domain-containing protein, partial [Spirochaetota bacterium]